MPAASIARLQGHLLLNQRKLAKAEQLLSRALLVFRVFGESLPAARALLALAFLHHQMGKPGKSLACIREAVDLLDPEENLDLVCFARQRLQLLGLCSREEVSLRLYFLSRNWRGRVEHQGIKQLPTRRSLCSCSRCSGADPKRP